MTDQLLPPDPSKDGWYWVFVDEANIAAMRWRRHGFWGAPPGGMTAKDAAYFGYRLASPHPIPTPEQLDALHDLEDRLSLAQRLTPDGRVILSVVLRDIRAALGSKPDDRPGNGLDDIRAAEVDQWGVPRAGEETAP